MWSGSALVHVVVVVGFVAVGAGQFFEEIRVLDGGGDFVVSGGPFTKVDTAAAVAAEWVVFGLLENEVSAGGAAESLGLGCHSTSLIQLVESVGEKLLGRV